MQTEEEKRDYHQKYRLENKDKISEGGKEYRLKNKDKTKEYNIAYRLKNKDKILEWHKDHYQKNKEKILKRIKEYRLKNKDKISEKKKEYNLLKKYGLSLSDYNSLLGEQNNVCKVCLVKPKKRKLFVDHCHSTGEVRGLLCHKCNSALGFLQEDVDIMRNLIEYKLESKGADNG